jgi:hypothetical protein
MNRVAFAIHNTPPRLMLSDKIVRFTVVMKCFLPS